MSPLEAGHANGNNSQEHLLSILPGDGYLPRPTLPSTLQPGLTIKLFPAKVSGAPGVTASPLQSEGTGPAASSSKASWLMHFDENNPCPVHSGRCCWKIPGNDDSKEWHKLAQRCAKWHFSLSVSLGVGTEARAVTSPPLILLAVLSSLRDPHCCSGNPGRLTSSPKLIQSVHGGAWF